MWGSNFTFLVELIGEDESIAAVYKPIRGEQPLWDFPAASLAHREVAAYLVSEALGWNFVPPTVYRRDAPLGPGSVQLYIDHDPEYHFFTFSTEHKQMLRPVVLFDFLVNNADRKGSHVIFDPEGKFWLIDHGICFHTEEKLRTVIWDFIGEPIPPELSGQISKLIGRLRPQGEQETDLRKSLGYHLNPQEIYALVARGDELLRKGRFPAPDPNRRPFPWPQI